MSIVKSLFGTNRVIPQTDETGWGAEVTNTLVDIIDGVNSVVANDKATTKTSVATTSLAAGATLTQTAGQHRVSGTGGAITLSASNAIADGIVDGQYLELVGNHATNTVTIPDGANTNLNGNCTLGQYEVLALRWHSTASAWVEISRSN